MSNLTKPTRHWMKIDTRLIETEVKWNSRAITLEDVAVLADLMDKSYKDTIDYEGETPEQCAEEMRGTLTGKYGPFIDAASYCTIVDGIAASASIVTLYKGKPLLAFSMTNPAFQGQGMARYLIERSIDGLAKQGYPYFYLVVTSGNISAERLYAKIGFKQLGIAKPGTAPPPELKFETIRAKDRLTAIKSFYELCGYTGPVDDNDDMIAALDGRDIVGVMRLVNEHGVFILRGMNIRDDYQRRGIGSKMLEEFSKLIAEKRAHVVYCLCGSHLETYYGQLDFKKVDQFDTIPAFLVERMQGYQTKYGPQLIMRRHMATNSKA